MKTLNFVKMHGTGNDYVYIDCFKEKVDNPQELVKWISNRHIGVGSDGLVLVMPSEKADFRMRMFNPDGSEAEMCGNASRCVGKYVYDYGLTTKTEIKLETKAGVKRLWLFPEADGKVKKVMVDMGEPITTASQIPIDLGVETVVNHNVNFSFATYAITGVSMGNPHAVIFTDLDLSTFPVSEIGPQIETHKIFPQRTNVEFVNILAENHVRMRVWERGTGETQACGTGACAVVVAGVMNRLIKRETTVSLLGGDLQVEWRLDDNHVYMTGEAVTVFEGKLFIEE